MDSPSQPATHSFVCLFFFDLLMCLRTFELLKPLSRQAFDEQFGHLKRLLQKEMKKKKIDERVQKEMEQFLDSLIRRERSEWLRGATQSYQNELVRPNLRKLKALEKRPDSIWSRAEPIKRAHA